MTAASKPEEPWDFRGVLGAVLQAYEAENGDDWRRGCVIPVSNEPAGGSEAKGVRTSDADLRPG